MLFVPKFLMCKTIKLIIMLENMILSVQIILWVTFTSYHSLTNKYSPNIVNIHNWCLNLVNAKLVKHTLNRVLEVNWKVRRERDLWSLKMSFSIRHWMEWIIPSSIVKNCIICPIAYYKGFVPIANSYKHQTPEK
jgi:hypothetical protein